MKKTITKNNFKLRQCKIKRNKGNRKNIFTLKVNQQSPKVIKNEENYFKKNEKK